MGECNTATLRVLCGHIKPRMVQSPTFVPELEETPMYWEYHHQKKMERAMWPVLNPSGLALATSGSKRAKLDHDFAEKEVDRNCVIQRWAANVL